MPTGKLGTGDPLSEAELADAEEVSATGDPDVLAAVIVLSEACEMISCVVWALEPVTVSLEKEDSSCAPD